MTKIKSWMIGLALVGSLVQSGLAAIPIGNVTGVTMNSVTGWASDPDAPGVPLDIHAYCYPRGNHTTSLWAVAFVANEARTGVAGNHAFTLATADYQNLPEGEYDLVLYALGKDATSANDGANLTIEMDHVGAEIAPQIVSFRKDYCGYDYENERNDYIIFSQYLGILWDEADKYDMYQSAVRTSDDGTVYCYYTKSSGSVETVFMRSSPNGIDNWTSPVQVLDMGGAGEPDSTLIADGNVIAVPDGNGGHELWMAYSAVDNSEGTNNAVYLAYSDDQNFDSFTKDWSPAEAMLSPFNYVDGYGCGQPSMYVGADGKYHMYFTDTTISNGYPLVVHSAVDHPFDWYDFPTSAYSNNVPYPAALVGMNTSEWTYYPNLDLYLAANIYNDPAFFIGTSPTNFNGDVGRIQISWDPARNYIAEGGLLRGVNGQITTADNGTIAYYGAGEYTNDWSRYWSTGCGATRYYLHKVDHPADPIYLFNDDFDAADADDANADITTRQELGEVKGTYSNPTMHEIVDGKLNVYQSGLLGAFATLSTNLASHIVGQDFDFQITISSNNLSANGDWFEIYFSDGTGDASTPDLRAASRFGLKITDKVNYAPWSFAVLYGTGAVRQELHFHLPYYFPGFTKEDSLTVKLASRAGDGGTNTVEVYASIDGTNFVEITDGVTQSAFDLVTVMAAPDSLSYYFDGPERELNMVGIYADSGKATGVVLDDLRFTIVPEKEYIFHDAFETADADDANADYVNRQALGEVSAAYSSPTLHEIVDGTLNVYGNAAFANLETDFASYLIGENFEFQITITSNNLGTAGDWFDVYMTDGTADAAAGGDERSSTRFGLSFGVNDQAANPWSFSYSYGAGASREVVAVYLPHYNPAFNKATHSYTLKLVSTAGDGGTNTVDIFVSFDDGASFIEVTDGVTESSSIPGPIPDSFSYYFDGSERKLNMVGIFAGAGKDTGMMFDNIYLKLAADVPPYDAWAEQHGLPAGSENVDTDNDGMDNLLESALGSDPNVDDAATYMPVLEISGGDVQYLFRRRSDPASWGLVYELLVKTNLMDEVWADGGAYETGATPVGDDFDMVLNVIDDDDTNPEMFIKLKVTKPAAE